MSDVAIRVEGLGKRYRIGRFQGRSSYKSLRESLVGTLGVPLRLLKDRHVRPPAEHIWALKDVSFEVKHGEVLGIIGRNGAGKSTLLKILSRITEPTEGEIRLHGRVGSLLEVGTGFHPELTGRENIYLNGAILGMSRADIERRFDEIVAFAEIDDFLDTPVKRYSSGMYMRLAFSVAAHLDPEILLVDEVLAVGDVAFQKKCLGKMGDVAREGRTVLFVSHNLAAINSLTERTLYLAAGLIAADGVSSAIVERYFAEISGPDGSPGDLEEYRRPGTTESSVRLDRIWVGPDNDDLPTLSMTGGFRINIRLKVSSPVPRMNVTVILKRRSGERVALVFSEDQQFILSVSPGTYVVTAHVDGVALPPGLYCVDVGINRSAYHVAYDVVLDYPVFRVAMGSRVASWPERPWGAVHLTEVHWDCRAIHAPASPQQYDMDAPVARESLA